MDTGALILQLKANSIALGAAGTPQERAQAAHTLHETAQQVITHALSVRGDAVAAMLDSGLTLEQIGQALGVSKQRAHQILKRR